MAPVADTRVIRDGSKTTIYNVAARDYVSGGETKPGPVSVGENVEVVSGKYVRLFGTKDRVVGGVLKETKYDKTFKIGDEAEYDSYNFSYTGKITGVGTKTVTVTDGRKCRRLSLHGFSFRNWNFDAAVIAARNAEISMTI